MTTVPYTPYTASVNEEGGALLAGIYTATAAKARQTI